MAKHSKSCKWEVNGVPCREFSTDGTRLGAMIAHSLGTDDEEEIVARHEQSEAARWNSEHAGWMDAEQADWEADEGDEADEADEGLPPNAGSMQ